MFALNGDPGSLHVTLWSDYEEEVQIPRVAAPRLRYRSEDELLSLWNPSELSFLSSQPSPAVSGNQSGEDSKDETSVEAGCRLFNQEGNQSPLKYYWHSLHGATWLHVFSALPGFHPVVKILLAHGADANSVLMASKATPLHLSKTPETARLLLKNKAKVNAKDTKGWTPLYYATDADLHSVVKVLLIHGAKTNITEDKFGRTPLHRAKSSGVAELLIRFKAEVDAKAVIGVTPLVTATKNDHYSVVEVLLKHGASPNIPYISPLHFVQSGKTAKLLIEHGAAVDSVLMNGETPLYRAVSDNREDVVQVLMAEKGSIGIGKLSRTKIEKIIPRVLPYIENLDEQDEGGNTLLHSCCQYGYEDSVNHLLQSGAAKDIRNNEGKTAYEIAISNGYFHISAQFSLSSDSNVRFDREFEICEKLGEGSFGEVYKAKKIGTDNFYAIKRISFETESRNIGHKLREFRSAMDLSSKVVVTHYDAWIDEMPEHRFIEYSSESSSQEEPIAGYKAGNWEWPSMKHYTFNIQMELMDTTLEDFIKRRNAKVCYADTRFPELSEEDCATAENIFQNLCSAVRFLHINEYAHLDLKPGNVLLTLTEENLNCVKSVKLADFGMSAKMKEPVELSSPVRGGTRVYSPPIMSDADTKRRSQDVSIEFKQKLDVYALGIIWVELLIPIQRREWRTVNNLLRFSHVEVKHEEVKRFKKESFDLLKRMLSYNPDERPTAEEVCLRHWPTWYKFLIKSDASHPLQLGESFFARVMGLMRAELSQQNVPPSDEGDVLLGELIEAMETGDWKKMDEFEEGVRQWMASATSEDSNSLLYKTMKSIERLRQQSTNDYVSTMMSAFNALKSSIQANNFSGLVRLVMENEFWRSFSIQLTATDD